MNNDEEQTYESLDSNIEFESGDEISKLELGLDFKFYF